MLTKSATDHPVQHQGLFSEDEDDMGNADQVIEQLQEMHLTICEIKTALTGGLDGKPGIIGRVSALETETCTIKKFVIKFMASFAGGLGVLGVVFKILNWI